jgi:cell division protein FtsQ
VEDMNKLSERASNFIESNFQTRILMNRLLGMSLFIGAALLAGSLTWFFRSGSAFVLVENIQEKTKETSVMAGMSLDDILVEGRIRTNPSELIKAVNLKRGMPIMSIDIYEVKKRVEDLPWIKSATVERKLPNVIHLTLNERKPIALWQKKGDYKPVDIDGVSIDAPIDGLSDLPIIIGNDAPKYISGLMASLQSEPALAKRVKAAIMVGDRRWNVTLDDVKSGISIKLPEAETKEAWIRLARLNKKHGLLKRKLTTVDLRLPDRLVVQVDNGKRKRSRNILNASFSGVDA